jgi:hypothetical protein
MLFKRILHFIGTVVLGSAIIGTTFGTTEKIEPQTTTYYMPSVITGTVFGSTGYYVTSVSSCATAVNNLQSSFNNVMTSVGDIDMFSVFISQQKVVNLFQQTSAYMTAASSAVSGCGFYQTKNLLSNAATVFTNKAAGIQSTNTITMSMYYLVMDINSARLSGTDYYSAGVQFGYMISSM